MELETMWTNSLSERLYKKRTFACTGACHFAMALCGYGGDNTASEVAADVAATPKLPF